MSWFGALRVGGNSTGAARWALLASVALGAGCAEVDVSVPVIVAPDVGAQDGAHSPDAAARDRGAALPVEDMGGGAGGMGGEGGTGGPGDDRRDGAGGATPGQDATVGVEDASPAADDAANEPLDGAPVVDGAGEGPGDAEALPDAAVGQDGEVADAGVEADAAPSECIDGTTRGCVGCPGGLQTCAGGRWGACAAPAEICNGLDDDCDGRVDEDFPGVREACSAGVGACARAGIMRCTAAGDGVRCDAVAGQSVLEVCDGEDNDCDGIIDEGPDGTPLRRACYGGPDGTQGVGRCIGGTQVCDNGAFGACMGQVLPGPEVCNGRDDDCDGLADESPDGRVLSEPCYEGPADTEGLGACRGGERTCESGVLGPCRQQVLPSDEICDGLDNDCNGAVDDLAVGSCACEPGAEQGCYGGPAGTGGVGGCRAGRQVCLADGTAWGGCLGESRPEPERCNGQDDDCDGRMDEDVPGAGGACEVGLGECVASGRVVCVSAIGELECDATPGAPEPERCNGRDDDCDGRVDEGLGLDRACSVGVGECRAEGVTVCGADERVTCSARAADPSPERCNGLDDDCDGQIDEGLGLGDACAVGQGICRAEGVRVCDDVGGVRCNAVAGPSRAETCNGQDDDCDGRVDENPTDVGVGCATGEPGVCAAGVTRCAEGAVACVREAEPGVEICDGLDNNCDGRVDEDAGGVPLSRECYTGPAGTEDRGECHGGVATCAAGRFGACQGEALPADEICDGLDNDCDGVVDELPGGGTCLCQPGMVQPCYGGAAGTAGVGPCRAGTQTCRPDGLSFGACQGQVVPLEELCNAVDDDCNGVVDDVDGVGEACAAGIGACRAEGALACDAALGVVVCTAVAGAPGPETCNGRDDDCNGVVDDVPGRGAACTVGVGACVRSGAQICDVGLGALRCDAVAGAPQPEQCNGVDDDCDGRMDEAVPGTAEPCSVGLGACLRQGATVCDPARGGVVCGPTPGQPVAEICNGIDDDCDGRVDEDAAQVGTACVAGLGACAREGVRLCAGGTLSCDAAAGAPSVEVCSGQDDDCDGQVDEGEVCRVFASCEAARQEGFDLSGIRRIQPPGVAAPVNIYCDQDTDGGGWTLVASTRRGTLNDQRSDYYPDLMTLAPAAANAGVWDGMRGASEYLDVRFVCRDRVGAVGDPMVVDLSFYDVRWYHEWTTGSDADSCFSEGNGLGQDLPQPARRDNVGNGNVYLPVGTSWLAIAPGFNGHDYLEGEDSCEDAEDFTVDLWDRGMDSDQSDGTDWGEDDGARKCGVSGLVTGQWFIFARETRPLPPPVCPANDTFEPNDTLDGPWPLQLGGRYPGVICGAESDWFGWSARAGCTYDINLTHTHDLGDLDLRLFNQEGALLASSLSTSDNERIVYAAAENFGLRALVFGWGFGPDQTNHYRLQVLESCP